MAWLFPIIRFGIGYGLPPGQSLTENWQWRTVWGLTTLGLTHGWIVGHVETAIVRGGPWLLTGLWNASNYVRLGSPLASGGRALLATGGSSAGGMGAGTAVAAVAGGYVLGATVGTGVAYAFWGEKGARDALDLYTGKVSAKQYKTVVGGALKQTFMNYEWDLGPKPILSGPIV